MAEAATFFRGGESSEEVRDRKMRRNRSTVLAVLAGRLGKGTPSDITGTGMIY
jgi:hypothetical protein